MRNVRGLSDIEELEQAAKLYRKDTGAEHPNQAPKCYWPSTQEWSEVLAMIGEDNPEFALTSCAQIPDPEIRTLVQIRIGGMLVGAGDGPIRTMFRPANPMELGPRRN